MMNERQYHLKGIRKVRGDISFILARRAYYRIRVHRFKPVVLTPYERRDLHTFEYAQEY